MGNVACQARQFNQFHLYTPGDDALYQPNDLSGSAHHRELQVSGRNSTFRFVVGANDSLCRRNRMDYIEVMYPNQFVLLFFKILATVGLTWVNRPFGESKK